MKLKPCPLVPGILGVFFLWETGAPPNFLEIGPQNFFFGNFSPIGPPQEGLFRGAKGAGPENLGGGHKWFFPFKLVGMGKAGLLKKLEKGF